MIKSCEKHKLLNFTVTDFFIKKTLFFRNYVLIYIFNKPSTVLHYNKDTFFILD